MKYATLEIKKLAVRLYREGKTQGQVAEIVGYSISSIKNWIKAENNGVLEVKKRRGCPPNVLDAQDILQIQQIISEENHISVRKLAARLGHKCDKSTIERTLQKIGLTYKKNSSRG